MSSDLAAPLLSNFGTSRLGPRGCHKLPPGHTAAMNTATTCSCKTQLVASSFHPCGLVSRNLLQGIGNSMKFQEGRMKAKNPQRLSASALRLIRILI